ncbi:MAG: hypothetical protein QOF93_633, partial [Verrucomicrobiota bacterium]
VDRFLELRRGPDGIDGTDDDRVFQKDEALAVLGFNQQQSAQLQKFLSPNERFRVVSVGRAGSAMRTVQMVFQKVGTSSQVISWKEF